MRGRKRYVSNGLRDKEVKYRMHAQATALSIVTGPKALRDADSMLLINLSFFVPANIHRHPAPGDFRFDGTTLTSALSKSCSKANTTFERLTTPK